ncbi:hypothetical protein PFISCL1PPCAC_9048, partial [Pristionchus fissidentatus]
EIVRRAQLQIGHGYNYDLLTNNCENFSTCIRYGVSMSAQAEPSNIFWVGIVILVVIVLFVIFGATLISYLKKFVKWLLGWEPPSKSKTEEDHASPTHPHRAPLTSILTPSSPLSPF